MAKKRYQVTATVDGKRHYFRGDTKKEANQKRQRFLMADLERKKNGETFQAVREEWWEMHTAHLSPTTVKGYTPHYKKALTGFGCRFISDISPMDISNFVNALPLSKKSKRHQLSVLSLIFEHRIIYHGLGSNPCDHVQITTGASTEHRRALTDAEKALIETNTDGTDGLFANLLLLTGLRRGEALALQYKDIDRKDGLIRVSKSVWFEGNQPSIKTPKTQAGNRTVVLVDKLAELIPDGKPNHFLFSDDGGKTPMHNESARQLWLRYAKRIGLEGVTPHYLRHNYATMLYKRGIDVKTAQFLLGHADIQTTMNIYTHVSAEMLSDAKEKLKNL